MEIDTTGACHAIYAITQLPRSPQITQSLRALFSRHDSGDGIFLVLRIQPDISCLAQSTNGPGDRFRIDRDDMFTCSKNTGKPVLPVRTAFTIALVLMLSWLLTKTAVALVRITDDHGGNIGAYWSRYMALRDAGEQVVIDGICSSACTLVLGIVPYDRICVTQNAVLGFHAAWRPGFLGFEIINDPATRTLWNIYPMPIRQWISRNGGLGLATIYLSSPELLTMYRQCR